ncbi:HNH endonuclease family protein [Flavobacterium praedii]|uniref:HNH endonuclease family protein n=1 Tax=Flavobacterium praedii TaxID=3002900 RepID=UPI0024820A34|nr:DUF262 domain-containing protein [Flavobacterium praedii]
MNIELREITIRELIQNYEDNNENGVIGYDGKLDIRPPYQREFIYKDKQREAVIDTITKNFPLNVMYWAVREDGNFEVIDGQQRTISICQFVSGEFAYMFRFFHNLQKDEQEQILNYKLMVYLCSGTDSQKLEWFKTINIAGEKLTEQELRNAVYSGSWVSSVKPIFSKRNCPAFGLASDYMTGSPDRQEYLETTIKWISNGNIEVYMSNHQHDPNANEIWLYFQSIINWVKATFPKYRREMKGIGWGFLYNEFKTKNFDHKKLEEEIATLMQDEDVTNKKGIYEYVLTRKEKFLNIRAFTDNQKREAYERQQGICVKCGEHFELSGMEADHITPWHEGGNTSAENCQMLCKHDNRIKSGK